MTEGRNLKVRVKKSGGRTQASRRWQVGKSKAA